MTKREKKRCSQKMTLPTNTITPATKYHTYSIGNLMAHILADKTLYSHYSF